MINGKASLPKFSKTSCRVLCWCFCKNKTCKTSYKLNVVSWLLPLISFLSPNLKSQESIKKRQKKKRMVKNNSFQHILESKTMESAKQKKRQLRFPQGLYPRGIRKVLARCRQGSNPRKRRFQKERKGAVPKMSGGLRSNLSTIKQKTKYSGKK